MDLGLAGRRALVMGASKGLGRSVADALAEGGAHLVITGRDQASLDAACAALRSAGAASATGIVADVAEGAQMDALAAGAAKAMGGVDILVQNHVFGRPAGFAYQSIRSFVDCLLSGEDFHVTVGDAIRGVEVILAIMESADSGLPVEVDYQYPDFV